MTTITLSLPDNSSSLYRRLYQEAGGPGVPSSVSSHSQVEKLGERWTAVWLAPISTRPVCPLTDLQLSHFEPLCSRQTRKPECRRHVAQCRHHWGYCVEAGGWVTVIVFLHVHFSRREICVCAHGLTHAEVGDHKQRLSYACVSSKLCAASLWYNLYLEACVHNVPTRQLVHWSIFLNIRPSGCTDNGGQYGGQIARMFCVLELKR